MAQAVCHRPLTAETWVHTRVSVSWICGGQSGSGIGFHQSSLGFPASNIPLLVHTRNLGDEQ
jgi:hypothetical protein